MRTRERQVPSLAEIEATLRIDRYGPLPALSPNRLVLFIQTHVTYTILAIGLNSRQVTVLWLAVSLIAYGVMTIGTPWAFVLGALLVYVQLILDGTDGEVGRYYKQFMTEEEDVRTHINGIYLDLLSHAICCILWGIALGAGLYRCTGEWVVFLAGVSLSVFQSAKQVSGIIEVYLPIRFKESVRRLVRDRNFDELRSGPERRDSLLLRLLDNVEWYLGSATKFNMIVLVCSLADVIELMGWNDAACPTLFFAILLSGGLCPFLLFYSAVSTIRRKTILKTVVRSHQISDSQGE